MSVATARELFIDELKDIYSSEKQSVRGSLLDAALIGAFVKHYELSAYGTVATLTESIGEEIHELLADTLQEDEDEDEDEDENIDADDEDDEDEQEEEEEEVETTNTKSGSNSSAANL